MIDTLRISEWKKWKEWISKLLVAVLSISLLFVQAANNSRSEAESQIKLKNALDAQRAELTGAFHEGTNQIIRASKQEAEDTKKAADQRTKEIESQATAYEIQSYEANQGTRKCPIAEAALNGLKGTPREIVLINRDRVYNLYDINLAITEYKKGESTRPDANYPQKQFRSTPMIRPGARTHFPFPFVAQTNPIEIQVLITTRAMECDGWLTLTKTPEGWINSYESMKVADRLQFEYRNRLGPKSEF